MAQYKIEKLTGGLDLTQSTNIGDDCLVVAKNVFYNSAKQLQTRRGYEKFGDSLAAPITSFFFWQNDKDLTRHALAIAWTHLYKYVEASDTRSSVVSDLTEYETRTWETSNRTRRDFAVYKNIAYMCNWVDAYRSYDGTSVSVIGWSTATYTFDNTTNYVNKVAHWLATDDDISFTSSLTMPTGVVSGQIYYVVKIDADNFTLAVLPWGTAVDFTTNGTGTITGTKYSQPRVRYLQYMQDRILGAWEYSTPNTLYYTASLPTDGTSLATNSVVVGWDEQGKINALNEYTQLVIIYKDNKVYSFNIAWPTISAIDSWSWGHADRSVELVGSNLLFFGARWVDSLRKRANTDSIEPALLWQKVQALTQTVAQKQLNTAVATYIKEDNNYIITIDTDNNNIPDTTLVYNSVVDAFTQYVYPNVYDYWEYINDDGELLHILCSGSWGQAYRIEYGFDDDGETIAAEVKTKKFDFKSPWQLKTSRYVDFIGYKQEGGEINLSVYCDDEVVSTGTVTDDVLDLTVADGAIWITSIWVDPLWVGVWDSWSWLPMYKFIVRLPLYDRFENMQMALESDGVQWILEKMTVDLQWEAVDVIPYGNIL